MSKMIDFTESPAGPMVLKLRSPGPESWSLRCRWLPATRRSGLLSTVRSWTTAWVWLPARTHTTIPFTISSDCHLFNHHRCGGEESCQLTDAQPELTRLSCKMVLYVILAVACRPLWRNRRAVINDDSRSSTISNWDSFNQINLNIHNKGIFPEI